MNRREELEAAIDAAPDDARLYAVYGDLLQDAGDPRGELIALQLAATDPAVDPASRAFLARHPELSPDVPPALVTWRYGFIHRANVPSTAVPSLIDHPAGRFLCGLVIHRFHELDRALAIVAAKPRPLREFEITGRTPAGIRYNDKQTVRPSPDFPAVWAALPHLTLLRIATSLDVDFAGIDLPALATLELQLDSIHPDASLDQIAGAAWPALERFAFRHAMTVARQRLLAPLRRLLLRTDLTKLVHLAISGIDMPRDPALFDGPRVLARVRSLDLSRNLMQDGDAQALGACPLHLETLDVSRNSLSTEGLRALAPIAATLVADDQIDVGDDDLYDY